MKFYDVVQQENAHTKEVFENFRELGEEFANACEPMDDMPAIPTFLRLRSDIKSYSLMRNSVVFRFALTYDP